MSQNRLYTRSWSLSRHFRDICSEFFFINQLCKVNLVYRNFRILQINQAAAISFSSLFFKWKLTFCRIILIFVSVFCRFCITSIYEVLISFDPSVKIKTSCILPYVVQNPRLKPRVSFHMWYNIWERNLVDPSICGIKPEIKTSCILPSRVQCLRSKPRVFFRLKYITKIKTSRMIKPCWKNVFQLLRNSPVI